MKMQAGSRMQMDMEKAKSAESSHDPDVPSKPAHAGSKTEAVTTEHAD